LIRISARLDFSRNETTSERYDPDETVVKSELTERRPLTESGPESITGLDAAARSRSSITTSSQVDYEISKTTSRTLRAAGEVTQLAVTILVADQKTTADDGTVSYQPRSDDELEAIRSLAAEALLLNPDRGDKVLLRRMPVERFGTTADPAAISPLYQIIDLVPIGKLIVLSFIFILFYWLVLKPLIAFLGPEIGQAGSDETAPEQVAAAMPGPEEPAEDIAVKLKEDVQDKPLAAAHIIRRWIQEA
jgi:flagellar M-ring protein FliF